MFLDFSKIETGKGENSAFFYINHCYFENLIFCNVGCKNCKKENKVGTPNCIFLA